MVLAFGVGIFAFQRLLWLQGTTRAQSDALLQLFFSGYDVRYTTFDIILYVIAIGIISYIVSRIAKKHLAIIRLLWTLFIFAGIGMLGLTIHPFLTIPVAIMAILPYLIQPTIFRHNVIVSLACAGYAMAFALVLSFFQAFIFLLLFAVADALAVYVFKSSSRILSAMQKSKAILGLIIPVGRSGVVKTIHDIRQGTRFAFLGAGDILAPVIFILVLMQQVSLSAALFGAMGAIAGILTATHVSMRIGPVRPVATLPFIAAGMIVFLVIWFTTPLAT